MRKGNTANSQTAEQQDCNTALAVSLQAYSPKLETFELLNY